MLLAVGWLTAVALRLATQFTVHVPANLFGICRGLREENSQHPGVTEWLSAMIDEVAGLPYEARPLRFGQLWTRSLGVAAVDAVDRVIDLRMISTCLSQGRPYELPWDGRKFFYDPKVWETLFPADVMRALMDAPSPKPPPEQEEPPPGQDEALSEWQWEEQLAAADKPSLRRLPSPEHLPVLGATRLSLSFPFLISAVPLSMINRRSRQSRLARDAFLDALKNNTKPPSSGLEFSKLWFTDGGLCSNFPVHLFDAALARRPTFAINLGPFSSGQSVSDNQTENVEYAHSNSHRLLPPHVPIPDRGLPNITNVRTAPRAGTHSKDGPGMTIPLERLREFELATPRPRQISLAVARHQAPIWPSDDVNEYAKHWSRLVHQLVDDTGVEAAAWGETDGKYPREIVEVILDLPALAAPVISTLGVVLAAWISRPRRASQHQQPDRPPPPRDTDARLPGFTLKRYNGDELRVTYRDEMSNKQIPHLVTAFLHDAVAQPAEESLGLTRYRRSTLRYQPHTPDQIDRSRVEVERGSDDGAVAPGIRQTQRLGVAGRQPAPCLIAVDAAEPTDRGTARPQ